MLRKVKFLALVAMFLVALSVHAQVTTSALSCVVTDENQHAMIVATIRTQPKPPGTVYKAGTDYFETTTRIQTQNNNVDGNTCIKSDSYFEFMVFLFFALLKDKNIRIKYGRGRLYFEFVSKKE